jgi:hypothetical protein
MWPDSSFFCSLVSRVASSTRAYLLAMANIASNVLEFFMVSFQIKDKSLNPFLKNVTIDLSLTSGMMFLFLQNHWMNSRRYSPFFWMALARSQSTPGRAHVARKLLVNSQHKWFQEHTDPIGSPRSQVLEDDDKQTSR